ncbi:MAG: restriction endonuclease [Pseudomonadota bacterium]
MGFVIFFIFVTIIASTLAILLAGKKETYENRQIKIKKQNFTAPIDRDRYLKNLERNKAAGRELLEKKYPDIKYIETPIIVDEKIQFREVKEIKKQESEFKPYTDDEKKAWGEKKQEKKEKGALYEAFVAEHYRSLGYEVIEHGKIKGKKDGGIDLIAKNMEEVIMIQCKNWRAGSKYTINHAMISAFVGNVAMFIAKNTEYEKYMIKRVYAISEEILDKSALARIKDNKEMVMYQHIPF